MKVLLCTREDYMRNFEGDSKQVLKTCEYLKEKKVNVYINNGHISDFSEYDIIHLFNLTRVGEIYKYYKIAHGYKKPLVISPIYWDIEKYYLYKNDEEKLNLWKKAYLYREEILKGCHRVFANSYMEKELLIREFGICSDAVEVVYTGVEVEHEDIPLYNFRERYKLNKYVLCVGRISPKKNQLLLAKICEKLGIQLVIIGQVKDKEYFKKCMKYRNVVYLGFMDSYNIYNAYRFAKVHALVSFVEKPGMSSLEAAACGCNIVSTSEGCAEEYFGDMAYYCNPYDEDSISQALEEAINKRKNYKLKEYVKENYQWGRSVDKIYRNYIDMLDKKENC
ncbi:glycosyltransferase family 4 protein [Haloimpatiens lingqiaonensis]|uniref:glycosyltransferase family 4 protein n=1 Tax=Haloimpatiens lingqiaonensis TaxID=1380675 RepID=UPI0010FDC998|nr:glycosyltransferase family 4 protein [Haloimpatiens lingqiaonensis]